MHSSLSQELKKIKYSFSKKFIDQNNPIHNFLTKKSNKKKNAYQIFNLISKLYINNKFDLTTPISFSAVRISDEMPFLEYLENNKNILVKSYSIYRQGRLQEAFRLLKNTHTSDAVLLKLIISIYLKKNINKLIKYKFINNKFYKNKKNFLLSVVNQKRFEIYNRRYSQYKLIVKNFLKNKIITNELLKYKKHFQTDLSFTRELAKYCGNSQKYKNIIRAIFNLKDKIFYTSEIMSGYILSLYLEKDYSTLEKYYSDKLILKDKFNINKFLNIKKNINSCSKKFIPDFNTSNLNGRIYTPNLNHGYSINKKFKNYLRLLSNKFLKEYSNKLPFVRKINKDKSHLWYDYSCNKKISLIKKHLHTAGIKRANLFTVVLYLNVPHKKNQKDGNLRIFDDKIPTINEYLNVKTGDIVCFPSYFFHETTPMKSKYLRKTINLDYVVKLQKVKI
jgi:hypothetical protein